VRYAAAMANLCPRCRVALVQLTDEARETLALGCQRCGGVFLESRVMTNLVHGHGTGLLSAMAETAARWRRVPTEDTRAACAICDQPMQRFVTDLEGEHVAGLPLDRCELHGTWFDAGELSALAKGIATWNASIEEGVEAMGGGTDPSGPTGLLFAALSVLFGPRRFRTGLG